MSLVGTRPPTVDEWDKYELHHRARLATKPGLTGMWQVSGRSNITDLDLYVDSKYEVAVKSDWIYIKGTIDFVLSDCKGTAVLSVQEQYLANDNISEIIGGHFKVLGKVISICKKSTESIDLLRKT